MPKYTVDDVLAIIGSLSPEEKAALRSQLDTALDPNIPAGSATQQSHTMSVGGDFQVGGSGVTVDMSQKQAVGSPLYTPQDNATAPQALLQALAALQQQMLSSEHLNLVEKAAAKVPIATLTAELEKEKPDRNLIDQSVDALHRGLAGVETLAEPVMRVAGLVAKAMVML